MSRRQERELTKKFAALEASGERSRAISKALQYEEQLQEKYANDPVFFLWNPNRALNLQDFDYLFYHRDYFKEVIRGQLEVIAAKITHVKNDGEDGYFKKLERNVGWTKHITPLVMCQTKHVDKLVRCGLWSNSKNSRRCHKDGCPYCHWNDVLKVAVAAFVEDSHAFYRMEAQGLTPFFLTLGFTMNQKNAKSVGRDFKDDDIAYHPGDPEYDPYPVVLGRNREDPDSAWLGYEDAKLLGIIAQKAIENVYKDKLLSGYKLKIECAFKLVPGGANRANLHVHVAANGLESDPQVLADDLKKELLRGLRRFQKYLNRTYYPDVLVLRLNSAEDLGRVIKYCEKVIPVGLIVGEAMNQPRATLENGNWNPAYMDHLRHALVILMDDDIPCIFGGLASWLFGSLRRRKTAGNMSFNDRGTCIGDEPEDHKKWRRKRAADQRKKRLEDNEERARAAAENRPPEGVRPKKRQGLKTMLAEQRKRPNRRRGAKGKPTAKLRSAKAEPSSENLTFAGSHWDDPRFEEDLQRQLE